MRIPKLDEKELQFCLILWKCQPAEPGQLTRLCTQRLGWSEAATRQMIRRLSYKGMILEENGVITALVSREQMQLAGLETVPEEGPVWEDLIPQPEPKKAPPRRKWILWAAAGAAVLAVILLCVLLIPRQSEEDRLLEKCRTALEALQSRKYYVLDIYNRFYGDALSNSSTGSYYQNGNDWVRKSYSGGTVFGWMQKRGARFTAVGALDTELQWSKAEEGEAFTKPWLSDFSWDEHEITLKSGAQNMPEMISVVVSRAAPKAADYENAPYFMTFYFDGAGELTKVQRTMVGTPENAGSEVSISVSTVSIMDVTLTLIQEMIRQESRKIQVDICTKGE